MSYYEAEHLQACMAPAVPNPLFNQIFLSGPARESDLESAFDRFGRAGVTPRLEIGPGAISSGLAVQLARRGFMHTHADPILIQSRRGTEQRPGSEIQVTRVQSAEAFDCFIVTYLRALRVAPQLVPLQRSYMEHWLQVPGWRLYFASKDDVPIGIGVLFSRGNVAYLAEGATISEFRARGAQTALILARLLDAREDSAQLVFSRAQFGSTSQRNLEKAGLESRYTLAIWTKETDNPPSSLHLAERLAAERLAAERPTSCRPTTG
ncbi:MAG: hypothetical protein ABI895_18745 [Deltaproteobacteria bacterium]